LQERSHCYPEDWAKKKKNKEAKKSQFIESRNKMALKAITKKKKEKYEE
jgi:hypothetical protein